MAFVAATIWGLWWIPIRYLETLGLSGALGGMVMNVGAFLLCAVLVIILRVPLRMEPRAWLGAALVGVAVTTYSTALNYADVVRVILLFYLAPAWSKIIEWAFMDQRWTWVSTFALAASFTGAVLILGGQVGTSALSIGDVLAVLSGMAWSAGSALIFTCGRSSAMALTLTSSLFAVLAGLPAIWVAELSLFHSAPLSANGLGMLFGAIYVVPIMLLTLWSAQRLSPATLSFLLTAEILSGIISGALFLDEPFGLIQALGAAMIIAAAISEVVPKLIGAQART